MIKCTTFLYIKKIMEGYGKATSVLEGGNDCSGVNEGLRIVHEAGKLYNPNLIVVKMSNFPFPASKIMDGAAKPKEGRGWGLTRESKRIQ